MKRYLIRNLLVVFCLAVGLLTSPAWAVSFVATLLHPEDPSDEYNSFGIDASGTTQLGNVYDAYVIWNSSPEDIVFLHALGGIPVAIDGNTEVGYGTAGGKDHALKWNSTAQSKVDLHPAGFESSRATDVSGAVQVGTGRLPGFPVNQHALLWSGTAESVVDLHPANNYTSSFAYGVSGSTQVGVGFAISSTGSYHALMWNGSAESVVELEPEGFNSSYAYAVHGTHQVGKATGRGGWHALLWNGSAEGYVDLHPPGFSYSEARNISVAGQVGHGQIFDGNANRKRALYWDGTAASAVNLHESLTSLIPDLIESEALGISDNGTIVGTAYAGLHTYAVLWTPVGLPGDFNDNGIVDAADYVVWRKGGLLANEFAPPGAGPEDYLGWRAAFGNGSAGLGASAVPETCSLSILAISSAALISRSRRRSSCAETLWFRAERNL